MPVISRRYAIRPPLDLNFMRPNLEYSAIPEPMSIREFEIWGIEGVGSVRIRDLDHPENATIGLSLDISRMSEIDGELQSIINAEQNHSRYTSRYDIIMPSPTGRGAYNSLCDWTFPEGIAQQSPERTPEQVHQLARMVDHYSHAVTFDMEYNPCAAFPESHAEPQPMPAIQQARRPCRRTSRNRHHSYLTWMPFSSYKKCAACFTDHDLKMVRNTILRTLRHLSVSQPRTRLRAVELWRNNKQSLVRYGIIVALECRRRGISDTSLQLLRGMYTIGLCDKPAWVFWPELQESHRAYLLLREERRMAVKMLREHNNLSWRDFCEQTGARVMKRWTTEDINVIHHMVGSNTVNAHENYYRQHGWCNEPVEEFKYPEESCLA